MIRLVLTFALAATAHAQTATYYAAFLRPSPTRTKLAKEEGERLQAAHMANIERMGASGTLVSAGPFDDDPITISGIFVLKAASKAEALRISNEDPTVVAKRNIMDVHTWLAQAGLGEEHRRLHQADPKLPQNMGLQPLTIFYRGPNWKPGNTALTNLIDTLHKAGKLAAAGPITEEDDMAGLLIFNRIPPEDARKVIEDNPAVRDGILRPEHHLMYSAAHVFPWANDK